MTEQPPETDRQGMSALPPRVLWLGKTRNEWAVHAFINEGQAQFFLQGAPPDKPRRIFKVRIAEMVELRLVAPEPYLEADVVVPLEADEATCPGGC